MRNAIFLLLVACTTSTTDNFTNPPPGPPDTCTAIMALPGCDQGSLSYSCTADRPDDGDANLVCSAGTAGPAGTTLFCCAPFSQAFSNCTVDTTIAGCGGTSLGFACGATSPSDADPTIACGAALAGNRYCCNTAAVPPTCALDPTVTCTGLAIGYACVGGDTPADDPALACVPAMATQGETGFCCDLK